MFLWKTTSATIASSDSIFVLAVRTKSSRMRLMLMCAIEKYTRLEIAWLSGIYDVDKEGEAEIHVGYDSQVY